MESISVFPVAARLIAFIEALCASLRLSDAPVAGWGEALARDFGRLSRPVHAMPDSRGVAASPAAHPHRRRSVCRVPAVACRVARAVPARGMAPVVRLATSGGSRWERWSKNA